MLADLVAQPRLSVITCSADHELRRVTDLLEHKVLVSGRDDLEAVFGQLLEHQHLAVPKSLDLIGHSSATKSLLCLGDWVLDATNPTVTAFFRGIADNDVLSRLKIQAVRLLGCLTADTSHGRWTICTLADILGVPVYGTKDLIYSIHYDRSGFAKEREYVLVSSTDLAGAPVDARALAPAISTHRTLDIDALPQLALRTRPGMTTRVASEDHGRQLLRLVRRQYGAEMPGLLAEPACEVLLPASKLGMYHALQVLLDGELVRVYPHGTEQPGLVYPVDDPHQLNTLVATLPFATNASPLSG